MFYSVTCCCHIKILFNSPCQCGISDQAIKVTSIGIFLGGYECHFVRIYVARGSKVNTGFILLSFSACFTKLTTL